MGEFFTEIDALCSMLGWRDGDTYTIDPSAVQGLKRIIWILKQDPPAHGCRLYLGNKRIVQTDLIPMVINYFDVPEVVDVLLRLLVNLTSPTLLLYNGNYPREPLEQRKFMLLNEISEAYKEAFSVQSFWSVLGYQLEKILYTDWTLRSEQDGLTIERILVLTRNVLQVPTNVDHEKLLDNDASLHDRMVWVLHKTGILDLVLYILGSSEENRFVIHALEIVYIVFREQSARELANATLARTANEKMNDEAELTKLLKKGPGSGSRPTTSSRNSWFRGTYTYNNVKSVSDNDTICHQGLNNIVKDEIYAEKRRIKPNFRLAKEIEKLKRKSVLQVRLFLREYSLEILRIYNNLVRQVRRYLDQYGSNVSEFHDESYLLWAFRFFLEFNRNNDFKLDLVSESLSLDTFHWIITRMNIYNENIMLDKTRKSVWCKRLHLTVQTLHELLKNLQALDVHRDSKAAELKSVLQHNIFYVVEYREAATHLLTSFKETVHNRSYLKDVVQLAHIFFSMLQKFCKGTIRAQDRVKPQGKKAKKKQSQKQEQAANKANELEQLEGKWLQAAAVVSSLLENNLELRTENLPTPFDSTSSVPIEEQKGYSVKAIYAMLHGKKYEEAIKMLFAARSVWTTDKSFGSENETSDELLMIFKDIFFAHLATGGSLTRDDEKEDSERESETNVSSEDEAAEDLHARAQHEEKDFKFEDFSKKLVDKRVVRACTVVLENWAHLEPSHLKAAVTLLYRIAFEHKMPSMLFHMDLLRVFRSVLCGPRSDDSKELARLAVYIIRQIQIKPGVIPDEVDDGVLLAEMLFYKTNRIAAAIEMGYDDLFGLSARKPVASRNVWTEEQEEELRCLFIENQNCPSNDEDVIDWLLSNIIDQTRSRQAVIKKLKELGLIFRAPTKRSNANVAQQGNKRNTGDDELLDEEYNELQLEENASQDKFSLEAIAKRLLQLRLIANVAEILPTKKDDSNDDDNRASADDSILLDDDNFKGYLVMEEFISMSDELFYSLPWILENLLKMRKMHNDPEPLSDLTGGMAMVPIKFNDIESLKNTQFQRILNLFGMLPPSLEHVYYRVPYKLNTSALQSRIDVIIKFMKSKDESIEEEGPLGIYHKKKTKT
ncbi:protein timeless homolog [Anopheles nili]|uniref:protein timeless homolog n=1 Tax=Anopheles nili TaxID=185578 RepID=UPI00237A4EB2|nr:protein timeless homolog [Anopheles nili]